MEALTPELGCVTDVRRAAVLLRPPRLQLLALLTEPSSATQLSRRIALPRQLLNYHLRELARARFVRRAGRRRKRNMIEQLYQVTARAWVLSPEILGPVGAERHRVEDTFSAAYLASVASRMVSEVARAAEQAAKQHKRLATLSVAADLRFESAEQRAAFATALRQALVEVIGRHSSPARNALGSPGPGRPYRLVVGCYPIPKEKEKCRKAAAGNTADAS